MDNNVKRPEQQEDSEYLSTPAPDDAVSTRLNAPPPSLVISRVPDAIAIAILGRLVDAIVSDLAGAEGRGKAFGNINHSSTWGSLIGITIGFYVLFNMIMETGWMLCSFSTPLPT